MTKQDKYHMQKETEFAVFCIENTALRLKKRGDDVYRELARTDGIESFLYPSYPTLHTQSKEFIVDEVLSYLGGHNPSFVK